MPSGKERAALPSQSPLAKVRAEIRTFTLHMTSEASSNSAYSLKCLEEEFSDLRLYRVLGSVPSLVAVQRAIIRINLERE